MKLIELQGKHGSIVGRYAQVSDEDYEEVNQYRWICVSKSRNYYAVRVTHDRVAKKNTSTYMHRQLLQVKVKYLYVDHIDHNGLNNQRNNIRVVTGSQNQANRNADHNKKQKGVYKIAKRKTIYWLARCMKDGIRHHGIHRKTIEEAINDYNEMALKLHGHYAKINT